MGCLKALIIVSMVAALLESSAAQTTYVVGDSTAWTARLSSPQFYENWAKGKTFRVGDTLQFNFNPTFHDVARVDKTSYDNCNYSSTIGSIIRQSPAKIILNKTGEHYYLCTFDGHCGAGQKLSINVVSAAATTPGGAPAPSPPSAGGSPSPTGPTPMTPSGSSPPPPSSARSLAASFGVAGVSVTALIACFF